MFISPEVALWGNGRRSPNHMPKWKSEVSGKALIQIDSHRMRNNEIQMASASPSSGTQESQVTSKVIK